MEEKSVEALCTPVPSIQGERRRDERFENFGLKKEFHSVLANEDYVFGEM